MRWRAAAAALALMGAGCDGTKLVGEPCRKHEDCGALAHAYCARAEVCTRECSEAVPCPAGAVCSQEGARAVCLLACTDDAACPAPGFGCREGRCRLLQPLAPPAP